MNMTKLHVTKKRLAALTAISSSVFLLAACEPTDDQQAGDQPETTEQDTAPTYGQRDRDAGTQTQDPALEQQDPAMEQPEAEQDTSGAEDSSAY